MSDARVGDPRNVREHFGARAERYARSVAHSSGDSLRLVVELVEPQGGEAVLDVGVGPGFVAHALAPGVRLAVGADLAEPMLAAAVRKAREAQIGNFLPLCADAHALPFEDGAFDAVTSRTVLHHCEDAFGAIAEMARVCAQGGRVVICDTVAPEDPALNSMMNRIERLRDATHVRNLTQSELVEGMRAAGLEPDRVEKTRVHLRFQDWIERASTPRRNVAELLEILAWPQPEVRLAFAIAEEAEDIGFSWPVAVVRGMKP